MQELVDKQIKYIEDKNKKTNSTEEYDKSNAVLNGIAYYETSDSFVLSGKMWDFIYEV